MALMAATAGGKLGLALGTAHIYEWCKTNAPSEIRGCGDLSYPVMRISPASNWSVFFLPTNNTAVVAINQPTKIACPP